jgi:hypothetical protein
VYQAKQGHHHPSIQSPPQLPPKISHQPTLPPKVPLSDTYDQKIPELPPKIKLQDDREIHRTGPTTDGKDKRVKIYYSIEWPY